MKRMCVCRCVCVYVVKYPQFKKKSHSGGWTIPAAPIKRALKNDTSK